MSKIQIVLVAGLMAGAVGLASACKASSGNQSSPTEAYKTLYAACKRKDTEAIKKVLSQATIELMTGSAQMQKKPLDEVIANGTLESTLSPTMPEFCKERVNGNWGAVEVKFSNGTAAPKWEDEPFVLEGGQWKVAVGDIFKGTYQKPGETTCMPVQQMPTVPTNGPTMPNTNNSNVKAPVQNLPPGAKPAPAQPTPETKKEGPVAPVNGPTK